jgi:hypothetical protein
MGWVLRCVPENGKIPSRWLQSPGERIVRARQRRNARRALGSAGFGSHCSRIQPYLHAATTRRPRGLRAARARHAPDRRGFSSQVAAEDAVQRQRAAERDGAVGREALQRRVSAAPAIQNVANPLQRGATKLQRETRQKLVATCCTPSWGGAARAGSRTSVVLGVASRVACYILPCCNATPCSLHAPHL